jgi:hypothetical protein
MTPKIKQKIYEYIYTQLPSDFNNKVYWAYERKDEPDKPFCLLTDIVPEQNNLRTSEREIQNNVNEVTYYKNCVVTVSVFVDGLSNEDLDVKRSFAENTVVSLRNNIDTLEASYEFNSLDMSINAMSSIRNLTTSTAGGYNFRYEFDITFGYNEVVEIHKLVGKDVNLQIERKEND